MTLNLHIERLVLDGFDLSPVEQRRLLTSLKSELVRLLEGGRLRSELVSDGGLAVIRGSELRLAGAGDLGGAIAASVYGGIAQPLLASSGDASPADGRASEPAHAPSAGAPR